MIRSRDKERSTAWMIEEDLSFANRMDLSFANKDGLSKAVNVEYLCRSDGKGLHFCFLFNLTWTSLIIILLVGEAEQKMETLCKDQERRRDENTYQSRCGRTGICREKLQLWVVAQQDSGL